MKKKKNLVKKIEPSEDRTIERRRRRKKKRKKKPSEDWTSDKEEEKKKSVKSCGWVGPSCVFNYKNAIELWVMETENNL